MARHHRRNIRFNDEEIAVVDQMTEGHSKPIDFLREAILCYSALKEQNDMLNQDVTHLSQQLDAQGVALKEAKEIAETAQERRREALVERNDARKHSQELGKAVEVAEKSLKVLTDFHEADEGAYHEMVKERDSEREANTQIQRENGKLQESVNRLETRINELSIEHKQLLDSHEKMIQAHSKLLSESSGLRERCDDAEIELARVDTFWGWLKSKFRTNND